MPTTVGRIENKGYPLFCRRKHLERSIFQWGEFFVWQCATGFYLKISDSVIYAKKCPDVDLPMIVSKVSRPEIDCAAWMQISCMFIRSLPRWGLTGPETQNGRCHLECIRLQAVGTDMNKILLAEDDNDMRRFLARALVNAGYEVTSFDNGASAYERLREEPFTLLLTDIVMPEMDGIELARRATELDPDLKVMFITGFAAVALNPEAQTPKDAKVLSKPFHLRDLVNEVEKMLAA